MATRDWAAIRTEYVTGEVSLRDLAQKHGVSFNTLGKRAAREKWEDERQQFGNKVATETLARALEAAVERRYSALEVCDSIIEKFMASLPLQKITAFDVMNAARFREVLTGGVESRNETINRDYDDVDDADVVRAARAIAVRAESEAAPGDVERSAPAETECGAGWTD